MNDDGRFFFNAEQEFGLLTVRVWIDQLLQKWKKEIEGRQLSGKESIMIQKRASRSYTEIYL